MIVFVETWKNNESIHKLVIFSGEINEIEDEKLQSLTFNAIIDGIIKETNRYKLCKYLFNWSCGIFDQFTPSKYCIGQNKKCIPEANRCIHNEKIDV